MQRGPSAKKIAEAILRDADSTLYDLYKRMCSHIPFEFTEQMAFDTLIKPEHRELVQHSDELYGHLRSSYYGPAPLEIEGRAPDPIFLYFNRRTSFVPPRYMTAKQAHSSINPAFFEAIVPWLEEVVPIREMYRTSVIGFQRLLDLCDHDIMRMVALWPTVEVIARTQDRPMPKLPRARTLPSPAPELREQLTVAQTFINSALMMPEQPPTEPALRLALGQRYRWP